jgi:SOS-response transcriptional repressor LexA
MATDHRAELAAIRSFDQLVVYLRDRLDWPIGAADFEDLTFEYTAEELGIDEKNAATIETIRRLRPLAPNQPWGIFFVKFEPKRLPVVALRRILSKVALKKRASANSAERQAWAADDLLFVSNYGEGDQRQISFAHFSSPHGGHDLPTLKVLGWDNLDTALHLDAVAKELTEHLSWPDDESNIDAWRARWTAAFTLGHREVVRTSRDLSIRLAELARAIRDRTKSGLAIETERGPLTKLMTAFRQALVHDLDAGEFADMYAQTISYGLLSARITDPNKKTADDFAGHLRTNPFLRELMDTFLQVGGRRAKAGGLGIDFDELGVSEVVELLDGANMAAVVADFGDRNPQEDPVIHFYELFLKEYDAKKRLQRGVFYTPRPVVAYIVRAVDELLRTDFGLEDGLADTATWGEMAKRHRDLRIPEGVSPDQAFVQVLDPATGTGTFLVETVDLIHKTLVAKWTAEGHDGDGLTTLWNQYVPKHLLPRLHGYELLMAPYAIAHLKIGLKLLETGYKFASAERVRVYLTNALEPASDVGQMKLEGLLAALVHEAAAVNEVKQRQRFTVVIGNPPYSKLSSNWNVWIDQLLHGKEADGAASANYYVVDGAPLGERTVWIQDDYIKFMRLSQWHIDRSGAGVHGFISNNGYLDNPTLRGMRQALQASFRLIRVLDLHGSTKRGETGPDGVGDKNVFDIQQGVAIGLFRKGPSGSSRGVAHADLWGSRGAKYEALTSGTPSPTGWTTVGPSSPFHLFVPTDSANQAEYDAGWKITDVFADHHSGIITKRDSLAIRWSEDDAFAIVSDFAHLDPDTARLKYGLPEDVRDWKVEWAQADLRRTGPSRDRVIPVLYRPFDVRFTYFSGHARGFVGWPVAEMTELLRSGDNVALITTRMTKGEPFEHVMLSRYMAEVICLSSKTSNNAFVFPLYAAPVDRSSSTYAGTRQDRPRIGSNVVPRFCNALSDAVRLHPAADVRGDVKQSFGPVDAFNFVVGVLHSPTYRHRYREFLSRDFPRIPLPGSVGLFRDVAKLGGDLVATQLMQPPSSEQLTPAYTGPRNPRVGHVDWSLDTVWLDAGAPSKGRFSQAGTIGFRGIPETVWNFHIGGYQVCQKWLKDRKGRTLSDDDLAHYQKIVVALSETIRLMNGIDEVIEVYGGWPGAFQTGETKPAGATVIPFRPRIVQPSQADRYAACVPFVPLEIAAGAFGDPQHVEEDDFEWVALESAHRLRPGLFVAQVVGKSMEPAIPDGAYCLFSAPVAGSRLGKTVLVQLRDGVDPETGERYTVKRYDSQKDWEMEGIWQHRTITLRPNNPAFQPIVLTSAQEGDVKVIAELVEVLHGDA